MEQVWQLLHSSTFWFTQFVSLVVALAANAISPTLKRWNGKLLTHAIVANAAVLPLLSLAGYLQFFLGGFLDLVFTVAIAGIYFCFAQVPSPRFRGFVLIAPNAMLIAAWIFAIQNSLPHPFVSTMGVYPIALNIVVIIAMPYFVFWTRRIERAPLGHHAVGEPA